MLILWRQFSEPYRRTVLRSFWSIALPMVPIAAYVMLRLAVKDSSWDQNGVHPIVYVSVGVSLWLFFTDLFMASISYIQKQSPLILQTKFHSVLAIVVGAGKALLDLLLRFLFCIPVFIIFTDMSLVDVALALSFLFSAAVICLSAGVWMIPLSILVPDSLQLLNVVLRFLIFFSLAIFPIQLPGHWNLLISANPFAYFIEGVRSVAFGEVPSIDIQTIAISYGVAIIMFIMALYVVGALNQLIKENLDQ